MIFGDVVTDPLSTNATMVAGFLFLVPTVSGWPLAQLVFLWAVSIMGIGSANLMTDKIADLVQSGYSLVMQPVAPQTVSSARTIYEMNLCMYATNAELSSMYGQYGKSDTPLMAIKSVTDGFEITNGSASCGSERLPASSKNSMTGWLFSPDVNTDAIESAQHNAMNQMQNTFKSKCLGVHHCPAG